MKTWENVYLEENKRYLSSTLWWLTETMIWILSQISYTHILNSRFFNHLQANGMSTFEEFRFLKTKRKQFWGNIKAGNQKFSIWNSEAYKPELLVLRMKYYFLTVLFGILKSVNLHHFVSDVYQSPTMRFFFF